MSQQPAPGARAGARTRPRTFVPNGLLLAILVWTTGWIPAGWLAPDALAASAGTNGVPPALAELWRTWEDPEIQAVDAFRIFDNLYYVGIDWVAAYVLETDEGLIVIDSLYGKWVKHLLQGITALGLDPAAIRYVIVTHGHFDHAGGAAELQSRFDARVVMTAEDWALAAAPANVPLFAFPLPQRDIVAEDGEVIELGGTRVTLLKTPGHTPGVLTLQYVVQDGDERHEAVTLGGVGLNFSGVARTDMYIASFERLRQMAAGIEVSLPNHAAMADVFERRDRLAVREPGAAHPFVDGAAYRASLTAFLRAAREKRIAEAAGTAADPLQVLQDMQAPDAGR